MEIEKPDFALCVKILDIVPKCVQMYSVLGTKDMVIFLVYVQEEILLVRSNKVNMKEEREEAMAMDKVEVFSHIK